jgi:nucleoside phosphorylase
MLGATRGLRGHMAAPRQASEFAGTVDFGVLAVREDELEALATRCRKVAIRELIVAGRQDYFLFDLGVGRRKATDLIYRLALARVTQQGGPYSQQRAHNMIEDFDPEWLMLVGIAGATPSEEFTLGDVVVASELHDFSVRAAVFDKKTEYRPGGGRMAAAVDEFVGLLAGRQHELGAWNEESSIGGPPPPVDVSAEGKIYGDENWREKVRQAISHHFPTPATTRRPRLTARPLAGGNVLMKDDALWQEWQAHARQVEAVEMELTGMYVAASTRRRVYPILVSKGISDVVGFKRHPDWTRYACATAGSAALAMLGLRPFAPRGKPDLAPLQALSIAEIGIRQMAKYPAATIGMRVSNAGDRPVRITAARIKTLQHVLIVNERATAVDNVPDHGDKLRQIETKAGDSLTIPLDVTVQPGLSAAVQIGLVNRNVQEELLLLNFGVSLFRAAVSLVIEDEFELGAGIVVADLYAGNPHGTVTAIPGPDWSARNRNADRDMLRDCLEGKYIIDEPAKDRIRDFLVRAGALV